MTTYRAVRFLIESKSIEPETAERAIFQAYCNNKIDGFEYEELVGLIYERGTK